MKAVRQLLPRPPRRARRPCMTTSSFRFLIVLAAAAVLLATGGPLVRNIAGQDRAPQRPRNNILARAVAIEAGRAVRLKYEPPLSSGVMYAAREFAFEMERPDAADLGADPTTSVGNAPGEPPADPPAFGPT